ncbi:hypothetical protein U1Q18_013829, partial [Sarracenia purpurea var. burkii]
AVLPLGRGAIAEDATRCQAVVHISGDVEADAVRLQEAAETVLAGHVPEGREASSSVRVPGADQTPAPSILANLNTSGFFPGDPFVATAECGANFVRRALTASDKESLRQFSPGMLIGHFWRDSSRVSVGPIPLFFYIARGFDWYTLEAFLVKPWEVWVVCFGGSL